jgi:prevent-host-death family protein
MKMSSVTANTAKQNFGELIEQAQKGPISVTKHGRPSDVVTSASEYRELMGFKHAHLKAEVAAGLDPLDRGEISTRSAQEIAATFLENNTAG